MNGLKAHGTLPGLDRLIGALRAAGLPVGTSEAIDAALLLRHLARRDGAADLDAAALRLKLRPVLCKTAGELARFDEVYRSWSEDMGGAAQDVARREDPEPTGRKDPEQQERAKDAPPTGADPAVAVRRRVLFWVAAGAALAAAYWAFDRFQPAPEPVVPVPVSPAPEPTASPGPVSPLPGPSPGNPSPQEPSKPSAAPDEPLRPVGPQALRLPWVLALLGLPLAGLLALLLGRPEPPRVSRRQGGGAVTLEAWPPGRYLRNLVPRLGPATQGRLQRHVRGPVWQRLAYARKPRLDLRRTVQATLERGGVLALRWRFARLRPAYLVLVDATRDDVLGLVWAERLRALDVGVELFRFDAEDAEPVCVELGGANRRIPFAALAPLGIEQRLVLIVRSALLFDGDGKLKSWVRSARLHRWPARALFDPTEPRDWNDDQVAVLEAAHASDPGMTVLPFEDGALGAWSEWLLRGALPRIVLSEPQLYPRLLRGAERRFIGDREPNDLDPDPARAAQIGQRLVSQLQSYLGQNGFYWLCACAVPPLLETGLALLLGEEYFRRCGATEQRTAQYMARNWRLLVRLPWLRAGRDGALPPMPQWLRLALLARLPATIQDELREVVRGALARRLPPGAARPGAARGIRLAFEWDERNLAQSSPSGETATPAHALLLGFVRDGLDARELMLRMPGAWEHWLPDEPLARSWSAGWRRVERRLRPGGELTGWSRAWRWAVPGAALAALTLTALAFVAPERLPVSWQSLWLTRAAAGSVLPDTVRLLDASATLRAGACASSILLAAALALRAMRRRRSRTPDGTGPQ